MKNNVIKIPQHLHERLFQQSIVIEGEEQKPMVFVASMRHIFKTEFGREPTPNELANFVTAFLEVVNEEE